MKRVAICIIAILIFAFGKPVLANGYNVIVIPTGLIGASHNHMFGKTDIEDLLSRSIIWHMEDMGIATAPSMATLKISIKNNPNYNSYAIDTFNNIKAISKSYGITKVMLVSTKFEIQSTAEQKRFWNKLNLPVITPIDSNMRIVTKIQLVNAQTNEVLWSDVFFKNTDTLGVGVNGQITGDSRLNALMAYYDNLAVKILNEIKNCKETRAIMISSEDEKKEIIPLKLLKRSGVNVDIPISKISKPKVNPIDENTKKQEPKTSKINSLQNNIKQKIENVKTQREIKEIREMMNCETPKNQIKNQNYIETTDIDTIPTTNFMHIKPRKNSRNYSPKFDSSINDI